MRTKLHVLFKVGQTQNYNNNKNNDADNEPPQSYSSNFRQTQSTNNNNDIDSQPVAGKKKPAQSFNDPGESQQLNLRECRNCGRNFAADRIDKHVKVCAGPHKKRKIFDSTKMRVQGTEAASFVLSKKKVNQPEKKTSRPSNWRTKHEEFIQAIRYAKAATQAEKSGGSLAHLPPPPASTNPDYVQCPHCARRFNQAAASRHIPKCKDTVNKPKPPPGLRNDGRQNGQNVPLSMTRTTVRRY